MNATKPHTSIRPVLKRWLSKLGPLLALFQRTPFVQMLLPEAKILGVAGGSEVFATIATVVGLGAFDSVAGATVNQTIPTADGTSFTFTVNTAIPTITFFDRDGHTDIIGWRVKSGSGSLPPGLVLGTTTSRTNTLTGTPTTAGTYSCMIQAYNSGHQATSSQLTFTVNLAPSVSVTPSAPTIAKGQTVTLTANAAGAAPFTYQWYRGTSGTTTTPVGTNSPTFTSPNLPAGESYWCRATDAVNTVFNSGTATVTVLTSAIKAATGTDLSNAASWTGGTPSGTVPGQWTSASLGGNLTLGTIAGGLAGVVVNNPSSDINVAGTVSTGIGAVGFDLSSSTVNMTWAPPVVLAANQFWKVNSAKTLTVSGIVSSTTAYSLSKDGEGTLALNGANTYGGSTNLKGGTIKLGNPTALGTTAAGTSVGLNSALDLNGQTVGAEALTLNGTGISNAGALINSSVTAASCSGAVTLATNAAVGGSGNTTIGGVVSGAFSLNKVGAGTTTLSNANSYSGGTTVSGGRFKLVNNKTGSTNFITNAELEFEVTTGNQQLNGGILNGSGNLIKTGTGQLWLGAQNSPQTVALTSASSIIDVQAGTLRNEYGNSAWSSNKAGLTVATGATFDVWDGNATVDELNGSGAIKKGYAGTSILTFGANDGSGTFSGAISNSAGTLALVKLGTGTQTLSGTITYGGATTVSAGKLLINSSLATATAAVTINSGATLGGSGSIIRPLTVNSGGIVAPGNSAGTLSVTGTTALNGILAVEVDGATADKLAVTGNLTIGAGSSITVNLLAGGFTQASYVIAECTGGTLTGTFTNVPTGYKVNYTATQAILAKDNAIVSITVAPSSVVEDGATNLTYTFTRSGPTTSALTVNFAASGTATPGSDYPTAPASVTIPVGQAATTLVIDPAVDSVVEENETVIITITASGAYTVGSPASATGTITNDDTAIVSITVAPSSVVEDGATNLTYTFTRSGPTTNALTVNFAASGTATPASDYPTAPASVTIPVGQGATTLAINPTADSAVEGNETVIITITASGTYAVGSPASATGTITNDDTAYSSWASALPPEQRAMNLTPQNDGVNNLLKFAFNLDPTRPDVRRLTAGAGQTAGLPASSIVNNRLRIEYIRRKSSTNPGVTYTPQCGSDLSGWALPLTTENPTSIDTQWERVTIDGPVGQTKCFGRVRVNQP